MIAGKRAMMLMIITEVKNGKEIVITIQITKGRVRTSSVSQMFA